MKLDEARIAELHREAMRLAHEADASNDPEAARQLSRRAFESEREAARLLATTLDLEPTRAILYRSAASLGLSAARFQEAYQALIDGLASRSPEVIEELLELRGELDSHLALRRRAAKARRELARTWRPWGWRERLPEIVAAYLGKIDHCLELQGFSTQDSREIAQLVLERLQASAVRLDGIADLDLLLFDILQGACRERKGERSSGG
jgi:hypothetical protein